MSHPIPGHEYGENDRRPDVRLNAMQKAMGRVLKDSTNSMKHPHENHLEYLKRVTKHDVLAKKTNKSKTRKIPHTKHTDYYKNDPGFRDDQD